MKNIFDDKKQFWILLENQSKRKEVHDEICLFVKILL